MLLSSRVLASCLLFAAPFAQLSSPRAINGPAQGIFQGSTDIGRAQQGSTRYSPADARYEIRGGGDDVWGSADSFRYTWAPFSGDGSLAADVHIDAPVSYRLAKGMLMFRQSLDPGSPYADIALHADGHITLQYRLVQGGETKDVNLPQYNASHLRIVRRGNLFTVSAQAQPGTRTTAGPSVTVSMQGPLYAGLGVCSHNTDVLQAVTFANVQLTGVAR